MPLNLKPHTAEWFAALESVAPHQAEQTREIIRLAGREDVCSICGDVESADYKVTSEQTLPGVINTLRLCSDCMELRKQFQGEIFHPLAN
jgi:hypothetical protein